MNKAQRKDLNPALVMGEIGLVHSVGMEGIPVYAGSDDRDNSSLYSRYTRKKIFFSDYKSEAFIEELCQLGIALEKKAVILSDDDEALLSISDHRERLSEYFLFLFPDPEKVRMILDKQGFSRLARTHRLPVPVTFSVSSQEELAKAAANLPFPNIIKPTNRSDWYHKDFSRIVGGYKKAFRCNNRQELFDLYHKVSQISPNIVLQEYVEGEDKMHFELNMYVDKNRNVRGYYIGQKPRIYPIGAGIGSYVQTIRDDEILEKGLSMVKALDLRGLLDFQFKRDARTGQAKLLEIHLRNTVWGLLGPVAGMNLYKIYYNDLIGREEPVPETYKTGVKYFKVERDIPAFLQYRAAGKLGFWEWIRTYRGDFVIGGYSLKDPPAIIINIWFVLKSRLMGAIQKRVSGIN